MKDIYLDNNATTAMHPQAVEAWQRAAQEGWGNASSAHPWGKRAAAAARSGREGLRALLGVEAGGLVLTSGGCEANVTALLGLLEGADGQKGRTPRILVGATEHPAVLATASAWSSRGRLTVEVVPVRPHGGVDLAALRDLLPDADGLLLMWANNETGVIHPLAEIGGLARAAGVPWHCDAVQAAGKVPLGKDLVECSMASISLSAHKFRGPKGAGALWVRDEDDFAPLLQERNGPGFQRAGTVDAPTLAAVGVAAREGASAVSQGAWLPVEALRDHLEESLLERLGGSVVHGREGQRLPNTTSIALRRDDAWVDGDELAVALGAEGIGVSTGAACATGTGKPSHVLTAMGIPPEQSLATLRLSLGLDTTERDVHEAVERIVALAQPQ